MTEKIIYRFFASRDERTMVELQFDEKTFQLQIDQRAAYPEWTRLDFQKCPNCTLTGVDYCPAALSLSMFLPQFSTRVSYEKAVVEVETAKRTVVSKTTFQQGIAAMIGLVMATSGCPLTKFLRPMARTHLPFASEEETVLRALAFHLLGEYVKQSPSGQAVALTLDTLRQYYEQLSVVNGCVAERIRTFIQRDAAVNAVIILESFALIAPENIAGGFKDIEHFFVTE